MDFFSVTNSYVHWSVRRMVKKPCCLGKVMTIGSCTIASVTFCVGPGTNERIMVVEC